MPDSPTSEPESDFVCDCDESVRSACAGESFYKEQEGKRYCVLHFPGKEKGAEFKKALQRKRDNKDSNFRGVLFPDEVTSSEFDLSAGADFRDATFSGQADFRRATFSASANFSSATFSGAADFSAATFRAKAGFSDALFGAHLSLETSPSRITSNLLAITCRDLAVNADENHRHEKASMFRYLAMEARRREHWQGLDFRRLSWWYWLASGYGERVPRGFLILLGILLLSASLYTGVGFARWEPKLASESDAVSAKRDEVGAPLEFSRALTYSAGVITLQKPEPRPATRRRRP